MREGVVELTDGRKLAYAELGAPGAPPVLYFHGSPSCRRELRLFEPVFERRRVDARVIALNRPGYGPSTPRPDYRYLDWPADVADAADRLDIGEFAAFGASGGCPFALACGYALADRVSRIGIVAGTAPLEAPGMEEAPGITAFSARPLLRRLQFGFVAWGVRLGMGQRLVGRMHAEMTGPDRRLMDESGARAWLVDVVREAYADGGRTGAHEAGLSRRPWGFDVSRVTTETLLWYGSEDRTIPVSAGRWLADRLPDSNLTIWRHGHFSWAASDEAADALAAVATSEP